MKLTSIRLHDFDQKIVELIASATGFNATEIICRCIRHAGPRFLDGSADISKLPPKDPTPNANETQSQSQS